MSASGTNNTAGDYRLWERAVLGLAFYSQHLGLTFPRTPLGIGEADILLRRVRDEMARAKRRG